MPAAVSQLSEAMTLYQMETGISRHKNAKIYHTPTLD